MVAEVEVIEHVYHVVRSVRVLLAQFVQYPNFDEGLMVEAFLIADDFDCHVLVGFVVQRPDDLTEAAFADDLKDFVSVADVVVDHLVITAVVIIVTRVECRSRLGIDFAGIESQVVDFRILFNFLLLIVCQAGSVIFECFTGRQRDRPLWLLLLLTLAGRRRRGRVVVAGRAERRQGVAV